jgi:3-hydroxyisobutyrate dehydrogenase
MMEKIGFIGTGVMGNSMAEHLLAAGYELTVYTRTKEKAAALIQKGALWAASPAELATDVDVVISMVGYPKDVEEIYLGERGVLKTKKGGYIVDMTTSSPALAKKIFAAAEKIGVCSLDAPVSGGDVGAKNATLAIMVGGEREAFTALLPMFEKMGKVIRHFGTAGSGQYTKMSNQIAIASNMMGVCEAIAYAKKCGLDAQAVLETISTGAAASFSLSNLAPRMLRGDDAPGFYIKHFIKDMRIALESADEMHLELPGLRLAKRLYDELAKHGMENCGTQALIRWYMK